MYADSFAFWRKHGFDDTLARFEGAFPLVSRVLSSTAIIDDSDPAHWGETVGRAVPDTYQLSCPVSEPLA